MRGADVFTRMREESSPIVCLPRLVITRNARGGNCRWPPLRSCCRAPLSSTLLGDRRTAVSLIVSCGRTIAVAADQRKVVFNEKTELYHGKINLR